jgi:hypothetical protein
MIGEIHILGLYAPAALVSAIAAGLAMLGVRGALLRVAAYRWVWHPGLFDLAVYIVLWTAAAAALDHVRPGTLVLSW